jgi:uncharacterized protein (TIGR03437 family)
VALHAQAVVTFPGLSQDPTVTVFESSTLKETSTFDAPNAFELLSLADGSQHYLVSNIAGAAITVTDKGLGLNGMVSMIGNFANPVNTATLSPDGSWLVVGENAVHILTTTTNTDLTPNGIPICNGGPIIGLAVSYDAQTAYALENYNGKSCLAAINLPQQTIVNTLNLTGPATALALGPNGLLYVSAPNQILEINPATLTTTLGGVIAVNASPGGMVFTPDGNYGLAVNQTLGAGPAVMLISLANHNLAGFVPSNGLTFPLDTLLVTSATTVWAYSTPGQSLYMLQIGSTGGLILTQPNIAGVTLSTISGVGFSTDMGIPGRNAPEYLFLISNGTLFRVDPVSLLVTQETILTSNPGALSYFTATATGNSPVTVLEFGNNQNVLPGATALPLVVQALDGNGLPISGAGVSFTTTSGTITPADTTTGADGYAEAIFTAGTDPADIGALSVSAQVGSASANFFGTVGPTTPASPAVLTITAGQGQLVLVDPTGTNPTGPFAPFTVLATDASGNPVPNAVVIFTLVSGDGGLLSATGVGQTSVAVVTNGSGVACTYFAPPLVFPYSPGFAGATVTASVGSLTQTFYITTVGADVTYCGAPPCSPEVAPVIVQEITPAPNSVLTGTASTTLNGAVVVSVYTTSGTPIPDAGVQVNTGPNTFAPNSSCADPTGAATALTNASGIATCSLVLNGVAGTLPLSVTVPLVTPTGTGIGYTNYTLTITPGPPAQAVVVSGNQQVTLTNSVLSQPLVVQINDSYGNPIVGTPVTWEVVSGSMQLISPMNTTGPAGTASTSGFVNSPPGTMVTVQVTAGSASATFTILVTSPAAGINVISGNNQSTPINTAFGAPLVVQVVDVNGNPAPFAPVNFSLDVGSANITSGYVTASATGQASTTVTAGPYAGTTTITATTGSLTAIFTLNVLPLGPSGVAILNAASFAPGIAPGGLMTLIGPGLTPTIQGVASTPSQTAGYSVTVSVAPGIAPTTAPILALVNQNGVQQINAQVPFSIVPGLNAITVQTPQGSTTFTDVPINPLAPGIFTFGTLSANGQTYPLAVVIRSDGSLVSASNPVQPGETITFYATGLGQTSPAASTGVPGEPGQFVTSTLFAGLNHQGDSVVSAIYQPNAIGLYAVTLQVPATATPGPAQPLSLTMEDATFQPFTALDAYVPIQ